MGLNNQRSNIMGTCKFILKFFLIWRCAASVTHDPEFNILLFLLLSCNDAIYNYSLGQKQQMKSQEDTKCKKVHFFL